jgi:hypothetical protein
VHLKLFLAARICKLITEYSRDALWNNGSFIKSESSILLLKHNAEMTKCSKC